MKTRVSLKYFANDCLWKQCFTFNSVQTSSKLVSLTWAIATRKQCVIITSKYSIYELPHKLPNDLRLRVLGNKEKSGKSQNFINDSLVDSLPAKMKVLLILAKNS